MSIFYKYRYVIGATLLIALIGLGFVLTSKAKGVKSVKLKNPKPKKLLFVGDSVTAIKNYKTGGAIKSTYPNIVKSQLEPKGIKVDVLAKGGETTLWMKKELDNLLNNNKYDRVYIYGGINDAWNNSIKPQTTLDNIIAMVNAIKRNGGDAFVLQGYNPVGFMDYNKMPVTKYQSSKADNIPLIKEYEQYQFDLGKLQKTNKDFTLVPMVDLGSRTGDGIHPNNEGQQMLAEAILKTL